MGDEAINSGDLDLSGPMSVQEWAATLGPWSAEVYENEDRGHRELRIKVDGRWVTYIGKDDLDADQMASLADQINRGSRQWFTQEDPPTNTGRSVALEHRQDGGEGPSEAAYAAGQLRKWAPAVRTLDASAAAEAMETAADVLSELASQVDPI